MDILTKRKISRLESEINKLKELNESLKNENNELKEYIETNNVEEYEKNLAILKEGQEKFSILNTELEKCRNEYEKQVNEVRQIKSDMIKSFSRYIKKNSK